jgi:PhoPQ-activated pathogenicity-related protein
MMDPFVYRRELTLPKLMIVGTNDRYWVVDAMNLYWDDLVGPKYALQVPNAGHGLDDGRDGALTTLAVFFRHAAAQQPLPTLQWKLANGDSRMTLTMTADPRPLAVRLWTARSTTKDFRDAQWTSLPVESTSGAYEASVTSQDGERTALFGEFQYKSAGLNYSLSTQAYRD